MLHLVFPVFTYFIYLVNEPASPLYSVCCILLQIYLNIRLVSVVVCDNANSKFDFERLLSYSRITFVPFVLLLTNLNHSSLKNAILKTKIDLTALKKIYQVGNFSFSLQWRRGKWSLWHAMCVCAVSQVALQSVDLKGYFDGRCYNIKIENHMI